jgi:hypothetical protein
MSTETNQPAKDNPSPLQAVPALLMLVGGVLSIFGCYNLTQLGFCWLFAFIFYYTICLGALFLVLVHHLTDAGWSVGIRRFCEHLASLLGWPLVVMFLPVAGLAPKIYSWMSEPATEHLIAAKSPVFTMPGFYVTSAVFLIIFWFLTSRLSRLSLQQDETGAAALTHKMRFHSGWGIVAFALTLTFGAALWVKALQYQWYSAMYGVYFFGSSVWVGLATVYVLTALFQRMGYLAGVIQPVHYYYLGVLLMGFTLFQAYIEFAQYFVVWNANMPVETFWYLLRERGSWWTVSMILIFGHFFLPFFVLLPAKIKSNVKVIVPLCVWVWLMHALDLAFNIFPAEYQTYPDGFPLRWIWLPLATLAFQGGFLSFFFLIKLHKYPKYPKRDPRLLEAMGVNPHLANELAGQNPGGNR